MKSFFSYGEKALSDTNAKNLKKFKSKKEAIIEARDKGYSFIVEHGKDGIKIWAWDLKVVERDMVAKLYPLDFGVRADLSTNASKFWLILKTAQNKLVLPLDKVRHFEKIKLE